MNLRHFTFFTSLNDFQLKKISDALSIKKYFSNEFICRKGDACDGMYFIISGRLQVIEITEDGREIGLHYIEKNDFFGELSVIDNLPRSADILALENSTIACLPHQDARTIFYQTPELAESMMRHLAKMVRTMNNHRTILSIPNSHQRIYAYLLSVATTQPRGLIEVKNIPKQHQIAHLLNTSRETVSRALREIEKENIIQKDLSRIIIRDLDALRNLAKPSKLAKIV